MSSGHPYRIVENLIRTGKKTLDVRLIFIEKEKEKEKSDDLPFDSFLKKSKVVSKKRRKRKCHQVILIVSLKI